MTKKQNLFVAEYLIGMNPTQAAIRAGYSKKTAAQVGHENVRKSDIAAAVEEGMRERGDRTKTSADLVVRKLAENPHYREGEWQYRAIYTLHYTIY